MARKNVPPEPKSRAGKSLQLYIPEDLADWLDTYVRKAQPQLKKTALVVMLLEKFRREQQNA
jgi:hypothetical protein